MRLQAPFTLCTGNKCSKESDATGKSPCQAAVLDALPGHSAPQAWVVQPLEQPTHINTRPPSGSDSQRNGQLGTEGGLTGESDVEASLPCGVISLELEAGHVAAAGDGGGELVS